MYLTVFIQEKTRYYKYEPSPRCSIVKLILHLDGTENISCVVFPSGFVNVCHNYSLSRKDIAPDASKGYGNVTMVLRYPWNKNRLGV